MERPPLLIVTLLLGLLITACSADEKSSEGYVNISIAQAYKDWEQGKKSDQSFVFLDVRTVGEYAQGHVPGAINIPVQQLSNNLKDIPRNKRVYVYCESGIRSVRASKLLIEAGISNVQNIPASMNGWRTAGYPIER